ncbi:RdRP-domain-containing protein [Mycena vitilis]|nr:RdRP-domain-containing protein [Mycena vitilis]
MDKPFLRKTVVPFTRLQVDLSADPDRPRLELKEYRGHASRATRIVDNSRRFMRVTFTRTSTAAQIRRWMSKVTQAGEYIVVGGRNKYKFFGFTENTLKAGHLLFFQEGDDFTVETLKESFGDLRAVYEESGYGKYAARLGMSFSSTIPTLEIDPEDMIEIPDLTAADGSLTSDGDGLIRDSLCLMLIFLLDLPDETSVFQIRLAGLKGLLSRCPDKMFDKICGCSDKTIAYRPSMLKYRGGPRMLEVQNVSRPPKSGRLNMQFILLLLTRGIPLAVSVFEELLQLQLDQIDKITTDRQKALDYIDGEVDAEGGTFFQDLYEMLLAGHDINEPYLALLLRRFQNASRESLRSKLHIPVKASAYLIGVVDHCDILNEGEVYINLPTRGGPQVGPVAVMRNPAYDPDGVRVLEGVNRPELKHLTNCIVFAASGSHSETDRMGGGDLDGDLYYVISNPLLIPKRRAAAVLAVPGQPVRGPVSAADSTQPASQPRRYVDMRANAIETFMDMRCNFLVGDISKEWMRVVGITKQLADLPECKALVPLIESALDAVKSGNGHEKLKYSFYDAQRKIAKIQVSEDWTDPLLLLQAHVPNRISEEMQFTPDPQLVLQSSCSKADWNRRVLEATEMMREYNRGLKSAMNADKENKAYGLEEEKLADIFKAAFIAEHFPPVENMLLDSSNYILKASVYVVGYKYRMQSFPWLGSRWLNWIKAMNTGYVPLAVGARSTPLVPPQ